MRSALIYNFLIEANILASIAILLMIPLRKLFRKQIGNSAICFGWLLVAMRLLIPLTLPNPLIHEIRPAYVNDAVIRPIAGQVKVRVVDAIGDLGRIFWQAGNRQAYADLQKAAVGVDYNGYPEILAWVWLSGCILVLLWFIYKNVQFRIALKKNRIEEISGELKEIYLQLCRERQVKPVPVYFTDPVPGACLVGVFKPYIVLPLITAPQDVKNVLTHEICHLKNRDHIWGVLRLLCCAIHWFNPLVWLAASLCRTDCELRCDDRVTAPMNESERKEYANVLVLAAARKSMPGLGVMATGMTMTGKRLKNRVMTVLTDSQVKHWLTISFAILSSLCLAAAFCTSEWGQSIRESAEFIDLNPIHLVPDHQTRKMPENLQEWEKDVWSFAGYDYEEMQPYRHTREAEIWEDAGTLTMTLYQNDIMNRHCTFAEDGTLLELQEENTPWLSGDLPASVKYVRDEKALQDISNRLIAFLDSVNPGMSQTIDRMSVSFEKEYEGTTWMEIYGLPKDSENGEWITFVVRLEPEWQIQYFSCISNG